LAVWAWRMGQVRPVSRRVLACLPMNHRWMLPLALVVVLTVGLAWALLQTNDDPCPPGRYYSDEHGRCVGEFDFGPGDRP
jgi:hypothetical protein